MSAPAKFLFDVDFASGTNRKPGGATITLAEHTIKLAEAEASARRQGYADAQTDAKVEADRRMADTLERIAVNLGKANEALQAIQTRLECEAAEVAALASDCFRELVSSPHIAVRVNDALYAPAREKLDDIVRAKSFQGRLVVLAEPDIAVGDCRIEWADGGIKIG